MSLTTFKSRLKYYVIGVALGMACVFLFFGNRGCSWLPGNRVRNMIAEKDIIIGDSMNMILTCRGMSNQEIYRLLDESGDVDFSLSNPQAYPKEYHINGEKNGEDIWIRYALYDTVSEVIDCSGSESCIAPLSNENKRIIILPLEDVQRIIESHEFRIMDEALCQMKCLGLTEDEVLNFHKSPKLFVFDSKPRLPENPYHILKGVIEKGEFEIKYVIGENRTRISDIRSDKKVCDCGQSPILTP